MLGICRKAGYLILGTAQVEASILNNKAKLVILDSRLSKRTVAKFKRLCEANEVDILLMEDNIILGKSIGRDEIKIVAVTSNSFKGQIYKLYNSVTGVSDECQIK